MVTRLRRYAVGAYRALQSPADRDTILRFQNRRLCELVRHCYRRVPYYRKLFDRAGLRPEEIRSLDDLPKIPVTDRADIQFLEPGELCAEGVEPGSLLFRRTSGSSGAPLTIRRRWFEERLLLGLRLQARWLSGGNLHTRRVRIRNMDSAATWKKRLNDTPWQNRLSLLPQAAVDWKLPKEELVRQLEALRPDVIIGTPSVLSWIADDLNDDDRRRVRPRCVTVGAETCTPEMELRIERGFGAPVAEAYGAHEFVFIASREAGAPEYRVCGESVIGEVLRDGQPAGPGEDGEFVGTGLHSFAMPFLRYRLGDLVRRGAEAEWHPHSVAGLASVVGRMMDRYILGSGAVVHPYVATVVLRDYAPWLRRFQIVQRERNAFVVRIVPHREPDEGALRELAGKLEDAFPEKVQFGIELVPELLPTSTGKFYPYVSLERLEKWGGRPEPPEDKVG